MSNYERKKHVYNVHQTVFLFFPIADAAPGALTALCCVCTHYYIYRNKVRGRDSFKIYMNIAFKTLFGAYTVKDINNRCILDILKV